MKNERELPKKSDRCEGLKKFRKENNKTQREMAELLGVTEKTYRSWENGEYRENIKETIYPEPGLDKIIQLAEHFKCSVDYILGRSECKSVENDAISEKTGLSDNAINNLKRSKFLNDEPTLFVLNEILSNHEQLLDAITDYIFFPDDVQTDYHLDTRSGEIVPKEKFIFKTDSHFTMSMANQNIPLNSDILRNALLNSIQENLILFKKNLIVKKADIEQKGSVKVEIRVKNSDTN